MTELTRQELEARAAAGDVDAMIGLGSLCFKQGGEERDKALRWYDAAADAGEGNFCVPGEGAVYIPPRL